MKRKCCIGLLGLFALGCTQPVARTDGTETPATRRSPLDVPGCFMCRYPILGDAACDARWIRQYEALHPDLIAPASGGIRGGDARGS